MSTVHYDANTFVEQVSQGKAGDYLTRCVMEGSGIPYAEHMLVHIAFLLEKTEQGKRILKETAEFCAVPEDLE